jgi:hypothetical protein
MFISFSPALKGRPRRAEEGATASRQTDMVWQSRQHRRLAARRRSSMPFLAPSLARLPPLAILLADLTGGAALRRTSVMSWHCSMGEGQLPVATACFAAILDSRDADARVRCWFDTGHWEAREVPAVPVWEDMHFNELRSIRRAPWMK